MLSLSSERDSASAPPIPATNSGPPASNIDPGSAAADSLALVSILTFPAGKIGLLPKRPVSLVNAEPQPGHAHDEDEEELEYVENPFEEGRYS